MKSLHTRSQFVDSENLETSYCAERETWARFLPLYRIQHFRDRIVESADITHISKKHKRRPPYEWTVGRVKFPVPSFFPNVGSGSNCNAVMRAGRRAWGVYVTLNCWRMGVNEFKNTITIHLKKTKDDDWQRDHCDQLTLTSDPMVVRCFDWLGHGKSADYFIAQGEPI